MSIGRKHRQYFGAIFSTITVCFVATVFLGADAPNETHLQQTTLGKDLSDKVNLQSLPTKHAQIGLAGVSDYCLVALNDSRPGALSISERSSIFANDCAVHSNSHIQQNLSASEDLNIEAASVTMALHFGGTSETARNGNINQASEVSDPFDGVEFQTSNDCEFSNLSIKNTTKTLKPGTYCGGIVAIGNYKVTLEPGVYVIKNGPLIVGGKTSFAGENVTFVFEGAEASLGIGVSTKIDLSAPRSGPTAGILMIADKAVRGVRDFTIRSRRVSKLEGVLYLPKGRLTLNDTGPVAAGSSWTRIISDQIELIGNAKLVINSDFSSTEVPLPKALQNWNSNFNLAAVNAEQS
ncbi:MAG: hypothetical protein QNJ29_13885 [Rhizobiaceae bacterium]|nr:hypothetical protein [Rhizobiaceae bacterium]